MRGLYFEHAHNKCFEVSGIIQKHAHILNLEFLNNNMGLDVRKPVLGVCEQQRRSPVCASVQTDQRLFIRFLESVISRLAIGEISIF